MAIEIGPIAKPQIWLEGSIITTFDSSSTVDPPTAHRIDHAKHINPTSTLVIGGVTQFDQSDILTFNENVRVVITGQAGNKFPYTTANTSLKESEFEGDRNYSNGTLVGDYAETYFTINGKDPVRTKAYLWKYRDTDDIGANDDYSGLGFILGCCQTGSDLITIKAKTYYKGIGSRIAIAKFKIARPSSTINDTTDVVNGVPQV